QVETTYGWDYENKLTSLTDGSTLSFTYNGDGLRQSRTVDGTTTRYVYSGMRLLQETNSGGTTQATYTLAPIGGQWEPLVSHRKSGASRWYAFDALGTTRALTDGSEDVAAVFTDDAWGNVLNASDPSATAHQYVGRYGYYLDGASGLQLLTQRYYDGGVGRFVSEDPARPKGTWFGYCRQHPVGLIDPDGRQWVWPGDVGTPDIWVPNPPGGADGSGAWQADDATWELFWALARHWFFGDGTPFTAGADVVKRQRNVVGEVRPILMALANSECQSACTLARIIPGRVFGWSNPFTADLSVIADDTDQMLNTLNGGRLAVRGQYAVSATAKCDGCCTCNVTFANNYTFLDVADMHMWVDTNHNGLPELQWPDWILELIRAMSLGHLGHVYPIAISWFDSATFESRDCPYPPAYTYTGWPIE
ncbi:MAG: RHS repeat-associated core domain-containing protein, partial [Armatimonadetes bacterium]|nr:RHS repeat-associated core domain-containing protein [Armatimonadota bacterium]